MTGVQTCALPISVMHLGEVLEDPQVKARELLKHIEYPGAAKPVPVANTAVRLSGSPSEIRHRAPVLGEQTDEILGELGYSGVEIAGLHASEVV